jgi:hypothetical protein
MATNLKQKSRPNSLLSVVLIFEFYKSVIGLYLGTNDFITNQPTR